MEQVPAGPQRRGGAIVQRHRAVPRHAVGGRRLPLGVPGLRPARDLPRPRQGAALALPGSGGHVPHGSAGGGGRMASPPGA